MSKGLFGWKRKIDNNQRMGMEAALEAMLLPIVPRAQFVDSLRKGLMDYEILEDTGSSINHQNTILIIAGFFSAALLLSIGIRILLTFIGAIGIIHYQKRHMQQNRMGSPIKTTG